MKTFYLTPIIAVFLVSWNNGIQAQTTQDKPQVVVYNVAGMDNVIVKKDIPYQDNTGSALKMDIYYPLKFDFKNKIPAVVIVLGYPDIAGKKLLGSEFKNYSQYISWCRIIAASGMAAIVYESVNPEKDIISLSEYLKANSEKLKIDIGKIGAYSCSAHTITAMAYILSTSNNFIKCAVNYYGLILAGDNKFMPQIDTISKQMGFMTPKIPKPEEWRKDVPIMIVSSGKDYVPFSNPSVADFVSKAIVQNLPVTLIHYADGLHVFDALDDNETTRMIIKTTLDFWKFHLRL
jgi:hypothetical protein